MKEAGVYEIVNRVNGKRYVGSSVDLEHRFSKHARLLRKGSHHSRYLQNAWNKYGWRMFEFRVLCLCKPEECVAREQQMMDALRPEYNVAPVAGSSLGVKHTEETRRKRSEAMRGNQAWSGKHLTDEHKRKLSEASKGNQNSLGIKRSEETRRKVSEGMKAWWAAQRLLT